MKKLKKIVDWFFGLIDFILETLEGEYGKIFILLMFLVFGNIFFNHLMHSIIGDWGLWGYMGLLITIVIIQIIRKIFK